MQRKKKLLSIKYLAPTGANLNSTSITNILGLIRHFIIIRNTVSGQYAYYNTTPNNISTLGLGDPTVNPFEIEYRFADANKIDELRFGNSTASVLSSAEVQKLINFSFKHLSNANNVIRVNVNSENLNSAILPTALNFSSKKLLKYFSTNGFSGGLPTDNGYGQLDNIVNLDFSNCTSLEYLYLLSRISSSGNNTLTSLNLTGCSNLAKIVSKYILGNFVLDLNDFSLLTNVGLTYSAIRGLNFVNSPNIQYFNFNQTSNLTTGNRVETLDISSFANNCKEFTLPYLRSNVSTDRPIYIVSPTNSITGWSNFSLVNLEKLQLGIAVEGSFPDINASGNVNLTNFSSYGINDPSMKLDHINPIVLSLAGIGLVTPLFAANYTRLTKLNLSNNNLGFIAHFITNFYSSANITLLQLSRNDILSQNLNVFANCPNLQNASSIYVENCNMSFVALNSFLDNCIASNKNNISLYIGNGLGFTTSGKGNNAYIMDRDAQGNLVRDKVNLLKTRGWIIDEGNVVTPYKFEGNNPNVTVTSNCGWNTWEKYESGAWSNATVFNDVNNLTSFNYSAVGTNAVLQAKFFSISSFNAPTMTGVTRFKSIYGNRPVIDSNSEIQEIRFNNSDDGVAGSITGNISFGAVNAPQAINNTNLTNIWINKIDMSLTDVGTGYFSKSASQTWDLRNNNLPVLVLNNILKKWYQNPGTSATLFSGVTLTLSDNPGGLAALNQTYITSLQNRGMVIN